MLIKLIKTLLITLLFLIIFVCLWSISTSILTHFNPNYVILENGERGYMMNTTNIMLGLIISLAITLISFLLSLSKIKILISKQKQS